MPLTLHCQMRNSLTLWLGTAIIFSYWVFAYYIPQNEFVEWLRASQLVLSLSVVAIYLHSIYDIFTTKIPTHAQQLVLGIIVAWTGSAGNAAWFLLFRTGGRPEWMLDAPMNGFFVWMIGIGGLLHLTAPRAIDGRVPRANWLGVAVVALASIGFAYAITIAPPDARWIADFLQPYLASDLQPIRPSYSTP